MFMCERCGSSYNPAHAVAIEYCPRCLARDQVASTLSFKAFRLPASEMSATAASKAALGTSSAGFPPQPPADGLRPAADR